MGCHGGAYEGAKHPVAYRELPPAGGQKALRASAGPQTSFGPTCQTCHIEHRGRKELLSRVEDLQCVRCHEFRSFNAGHPPLRVSAPPAPGSLLAKFSHKQHLSITTERLTCPSCHVQGDPAAGRDFSPVAFGAACQKCHALQPTPDLKEWLKAEEVEALKGQLRVQTRRGRLFKVAREPKAHRDSFIIAQLEGISESLLTIRKSALGGDPPPGTREAWEARFQEGEKKKELEEYRRLQSLGGALFAPCKGCHATRESGGLEWSQADFRIQPLTRLQGAIWPRARFRHRPHLTLGEQPWKGQPCEACHQEMRQAAAGAPTSLPSIQTCQGCHAPSKVRNFCQNCHTFHLRAAAPPASSAGAKAHPGQSVF